MSLFLFGISGGEIIIVFLVILMLFGSDKIPDLAKTFGKGINEFKKAADEIKREIQDSATEMKDDLMEARKSIETETKQLKKDLQEPIGYDPYDLSDEGTEFNSEEPEISTTRKRVKKTVKKGTTSSDENTPDDVDAEKYNK